MAEGFEFEIEGLDELQKDLEKAIKKAPAQAEETLVEIAKEFTDKVLHFDWINDFAEYHDEERTFNIAKSGMYSRGDVIKVNLGFNIGNELGGLHYCIVLNKYDNTRNGALNIIPLTSRKDNKKYDSSSVNLGKELYNVFQEKIEKEKQKLQQILSELEKIEDVPVNIQNITEKEQKIYFSS